MCFATVMCVASTAFFAATNATHRTFVRNLFIVFSGEIGYLLRLGLALGFVVGVI